MLKPKAGCYYVTGKEPNSVMYMKVTYVIEGTDGKVSFIDSFDPKNKKQWSFLADWKKDLKSGEIRVADELTAKKSLGELK